MSDKIKLFELATKRVVDNKDFIAFYLAKYCEIEHISRPEIIDKLGCSLEQYAKLGLCTVPMDNYIEGLNTISEYTGTQVMMLNSIIKRVNSVTAFSGSNENKYLLAARDKKNKDDKKGGDR